MMAAESPTFIYIFVLRAGRVEEYELVIARRPLLPERILRGNGCVEDGGATKRRVHVQRVQIDSIRGRHGDMRVEKAISSVKDPI